MTANVSMRCKHCKQTMIPRWYSPNDDVVAKVYVMLCKDCDMVDLIPEVVPE